MTGSIGRDIGQARTWSFARAAPNLLILEQSDSIYLIPQRAKPIRLNFPASFIWQKLTERRAFDETADFYAGNFDTDLEEARTVIENFLTAMIENGYLVKDCQFDGSVQ
jgi:hypothetical protein